jgi:deoxyribodipyrimidine photo-lyase
LPTPPFGTARIFSGARFAMNLEAFLIRTTWNAWCQGTTGIPIVDAAARQLLKEGFVHNRARMISASFLTKNLNLSYKKGEAHYLKYLADGDWALNNMGWQWSAGCGVDAAPYFRVFNPVLQGKRFDPNGDYVRRFVPELDQLPPKYIHRPWEAPVSILREANVRLEETYPTPIVDLKQSRSEYLKLVKSWLASKR